MTFKNNRLFFFLIVAMYCSTFLFSCGGSGDGSGGGSQQMTLQGNFTLQSQTSISSKASMVSQAIDINVDDSVTKVIAMKLSGQYEPDYTTADVNEDGSFSIMFDHGKWPHVFIFAGSEGKYLGYLNFSDGDFSSVPTSLVSTDPITCEDLDISSDGVVESGFDIVEYLNINSLLEDTVIQAGQIASLTAEHSDFDKDGKVD